MMEYALIVEDYEDTRLRLSNLVASAFPGIHIETAGSVAEALHLIRQHQPQLSLVDLGLPDGSGTEVLEALRRTVPDACSAVVTVYDDDAHIGPALRAGAQGYLLKDEPGEVLVEQLRALLRHELPMSAAAARYVKNQLSAM